MDVVSVILIAAAALVSAAITYFLTKKKSSGVSDKGEDNYVIEDLKKKVKSLSSQKEQIESLFKEARSKSDELSNQLEALSSGKNANPEVLDKLAEADKLRKKIEQLEEEIEENEEDLEDAEKKLKKRNAEISELQDQKRALDKEFKSAKEEINVLNDELKKKTEELALKMESLTFVQSILSAPEFSDSATRNLYQKVDKLRNFIQEDLYDIIKAIWDIEGNSDVSQLFGDKLYRWEAMQKKSWIANKVAIAFVGEFSAGKTSIVNRILSQDNPDVPKLPVSTKATTAIPTYISGGVKTDYKFFTQDNKLKKITAEDFNRVTKEVLDQIGGVSNLIQYFVMTYKNENLNNLSILDTPGFNSNDEEDSIRTLEVINECDALFWVFDVNAGTVNKSSIDLIKKNLKKPLYVVINKVDTKPDSEVDKVEKLISETFMHEGVKVEQYIRFSSKASLSTIMDPVKSVNSTCQGNDYLKSVEDFVKDVEKALKDDLKEKNKDYNEWNDAFDTAKEQFDDNYAILEENCELAVNIIDSTWTENWFSKDKYEMSKEVGEQLKETITDYIADNNMKVIRENHEAIVEISKHLQTSYSDLCDSRDNIQIIQKLLVMLRKNIKSLNNN